MYTRHMADNLMDAMDKMNATIQEKRLRKMIQEGDMEQIAARAEAQRKLDEDKMLHQRMDDEMKREQELKYGEKYFYDENGNRIGRATVPVGQLAPVQQNKNVDSIANDIAAQGYGAQAANKIGAVNNNPVDVSQMTGISRTPLEAVGSGLSDGASSAGRLAGDSVGLASKNLLTGGVPIASLIGGMYDVASGGERYRATGGDEVARAERQLAQMTPEQRVAYLNIINRDKKQGANQVAPAQTLTPEEIKRIEDEKRMKRQIDAIRNANAV